ncbi:ADP-ribosylation_factor 1 [Hexamita inflata]|uniref:ADP-ribosylation factor 1 n=1 Tax=Hexamita inflata TaxID=28002 RepID=A0AA86NEJ1_9EUKA|nr:ADP-ribosylation factor 1 [Hexamita inflata]
MNYINKLFRKKHYLMVGSPCCGISSIIRIIAPKYIEPIPIMGFNYNRVKVNLFLNLTCFSISGFKMWPLLRHFFQEITGMIFVIDSSDFDSIFIKQCLTRLFKEELLESQKVLFLLNKMDLKTSKTMEQIIDELNIESLTREYKVVQINALTGQGVKEGLKYLD